MYRMLKEFGVVGAHFHCRFMSAMTFPKLCLFPHFLPRLCSHDLLLPTMTHCHSLTPLLHRVGLAHLSSFLIFLHAPFPIISILFSPSYTYWPLRHLTGK
ncbi:hypothetical protein K443DRAFT_418737 [Laccaria amethystina LaAM-08-1]|uniref:Uncharacterized protein n=1 Tax=Laccaria amethystina LaAM-08-1 TaxID=1095629 RepID=A0A0C9WIG9_9AGAR|nr:hypothetical protein K443DRAFT_418737 [Laccaria amethystina LaAM-08-1]